MLSIREVLTELSNETSIKIRFMDNNNNEIYDNLPNTESKLMRKVVVDNKIYKVMVEQQDLKIIPILEYVLNKFSKKENIIEDLMEGRKQWESLDNVEIINSNKLLIIETDKKNEALEIVRNTYTEQEIYVGEIYDRIIIIGNLKYENEHALSLKESLSENLGVKAKVSIADLDGTFEGFVTSYNNALKAIEIGKRFKIKPEIYFYKNMYLEKAVFSFSEEYSNELREEYKNIFNGFNYELIQTLEEILKNDLSLTKAAKNLFIHRNTIMYRIEKIKKETGFDIRNFKEAVFLYILYINNNRN